MSHTHRATSPYEQLRIKLLRELFQCEHDVATQPAREARRLGDSPPGIALRALANHGAVALHQLSTVSAHGAEARARIGTAISDVVSLVRFALVDRLIDVERSYRAQLLQLRHGLDVIRLLREVAGRDGDRALSLWCEDTLIERESLIEDAEVALGWFAARPQLALRTGAAVAMHSS